MSSTILPSVASAWPKPDFSVENFGGNESKPSHPGALTSVDVQQIMKGVTGNSLRAEQGSTARTACMDLLQEKEDVSPDAARKIRDIEVKLAPRNTTKYVYFVGARTDDIFQKFQTLINRPVQINSAETHKLMHPQGAPIVNSRVEDAAHRLFNLRLGQQQNPIVIECAVSGDSEDVHGAKGSTGPYASGAFPDRHRMLLSDGNRYITAAVTQIDLPTFARMTGTDQTALRRMTTQWKGPVTVVKVAAWGNKGGEENTIAEAKAVITRQGQNGETPLDQLSTMAKNAHGLTDAIANGRIVQVETMLRDKDVDPSMRDSNGHLPLETAITVKQHGILRLLLKNGAKATQRTGDGDPLLHKAIATDNLTAAKILLENGTDIDAQNNGYTALQYAASTNKAEAVRFLIEHNANPNKCFTNTTKVVLPALCIAAEKGHVDVVALLLHPDLGKRAHVDAVDENGNSALHIAARRGKDEIVALLLKRGANPLLKNRFDWRPIQGVQLKLQNKELDPEIRQSFSHIEGLIQKQAKALWDLHTEVTSESPDIYRVEGLAERVNVNLTPSQPPAEANSKLLLSAVKKGNEKIVGILLKNGADPTAKGEDKKSAVALAIQYRRPEILELLLQHGADPNQSIDRDGRTALQEAISNTDLKTVQTLMRYGANIYASSPREASPIEMGHRKTWRVDIRDALKNRDKVIQSLSTAISKGDISEIKSILEKHKIHPNHPIGSDQFSPLPLIAAIKEGQAEAVQLLLTEGADPNVVDPLTERRALSTAAILGETDIAKSLVAHGADVDARDELLRAPLQYAAGMGNVDIIRLLLQNKADIHVLDEEGWTPLHHAAHCKQIEAAKLLVKNGADVDAPNAKGETPLHNAARSGQPEMVEFLLENGANITIQNGKGVRPLGAALQAGNIETMNFLVQRGADVNAKDKANSTLLQQAANNGDIKAMKFLLANNADIEARGPYGQTALHFAALKGHFSAVKLLLERGADANALDDNDAAPLHKAAQNGDLGVAHLLLTHQANVDIHNERIGTPLHTAVENNRFDMVSLLLKNKADLTLRRNGQTAREIAKLKKYKDIKKLLPHSERNASPDQSGLPRNRSWHFLARMQSSANASPGEADALAATSAKVPRNKSWSGLATKLLAGVHGRSSGPDALLSVIGTRLKSMNPKTNEADFRAYLTDFAVQQFKLRHVQGMDFDTLLPNIFEEIDEMVDHSGLQKSSFSDAKLAIKQKIFAAGMEMASDKPLDFLSPFLGLEFENKDLMVVNLARERMRKSITFHYSLKAARQTNYTNGERDNLGKYLYHAMDLLLNPDDENLKKYFEDSEASSFLQITRGMALKYFEAVHHDRVKDFLEGAFSADNTDYGAVVKQLLNYQVKA